MSKGVIFDIKELTIHDGPGVRITVFLKGCPLRCVWCHNPEGLSKKPQTMKGKDGVDRICGREIDSSVLVARIKKNEQMLQHLNGGVTISGGEPLMQPDFLLDTLKQLHPIHRVLQTSGYGEENSFIKAAENCELVHFDLKLISQELHERYTGKDNILILRNLENLKSLGCNFVARLVMINGANTDESNVLKIAELLEPVKGRVSLELLPYNPFSGAKYALIDKEYTFKPKPEKQPYPVHIFEQAGLYYRIL